MFEKVKKNFGFGCMRLPMKNDEVDYEEFCKMVDTFMDNGFNYFDTAHGYINTKSEIAVRECLVKRYPRESFVLTNKLTGTYFQNKSDIREFFNSQLKACGVEYFDFYLMHAQNKEIYEKFKKCQAYEQALMLKDEGLIKHFGISFHDTADVLDNILNEYPQIEVVQIQLNYIDYDDIVVQSRKCLEVCNKHNKKVIVMEPVKGGNLVNLPLDAKKYLDELDGGSYASYAIRFAASLKGVFMVLSGMSNIIQMNDNVSFMKDFKPLDEREIKAIHNVCDVFKKMNLIPCTACRYCIDGCPQKIIIPDLFACLNTHNLYHDWNANYYYQNCLKTSNKASMCIKCGKCEKSCPQHLPIRELLEQVAKEFEK